MDQSYTDEIAGLKDRKRLVESEADQLQAQRREDISKLLQERQRRLQILVTPQASPTADRSVSIELTQSERGLASEDDGDADKVRSEKAGGDMEMRAQGPTYYEMSNM